MKIPMEDWLRGCVYHDGRHGEVTLPTDKVLEIANYIQLTRTSISDGCIELPPYADTPQKDKEALLNDAYYRVFKDLTREDGFLTGIYDAKNGKREFMYGISTVMECIAYKCGHDCGDAFSERFAKNMIKSEEKGSEE